MGSIYKRGNIYWIEYYRNGKPLRESTESKKEADAKRLLKKREGEISQGKQPGIYFDRVTSNELAEDYLTDFKVNGEGLYRAQNSVENLMVMSDDMRVVNIDTSKVRKYTEYMLDEGYAPGTINRDLSALKRMLNLAAK